MWVVYWKYNNQVVGVSALSTTGLEKADILTEIVTGLEDHEDLDQYDAFETEDPEHVRLVTSPETRPHLWVRQKKDGTPQVVVGGGGRAFSLSLRTEGTERHPIDGVAVIPADGESVVEVLVQKIDREGGRVARARDSDVLWLRTDAGRLLDAKGHPTRNVQLNRGEGVFQVRSDPAPRLATVRVFNADPGLVDAVIQIEFAPEQTLKPVIRGNDEDGPVAITALKAPAAYEEDLVRAVEILKKCKEVYVYGSVAKGKVRKGSDIDLAVRGCPKGKLLALRRQLRKELANKTSLLNLDEDAPFVRHVMSVGAGLTRIA